jgi:hypothetical protein
MDRLFGVNIRGLTKDKIMKGKRVLACAALLLILGSHQAASRGPVPKLENLIKIEFPASGYKFTRAEAARGIKITYKIVVGRDCRELIALPSGPSYNAPPGPSGLYPREQISGRGHLYCLMDFGLGAPPQEVARTIKKGTYLHSFTWDGRNWTGPSDFGNPKGKPFPAGAYELVVSVGGKVVTEKGKAPFAISGKTKLVLE